MAVVVIVKLFLFVGIIVEVILVVEVVVVVSEVKLVVVVVVAVVNVVSRAPLCAGAAIDTFVEVLAVDMRVDVLIVSNVAVTLLMDVTGIIRGVLTNITVDVLMDVNVNVCADVTTPFNFFMLGQL